MHRSGDIGWVALVDGGNFFLGKTKTKQLIIHQSNYQTHISKLL